MIDSKLIGGVFTDTMGEDGVERHESFLIELELLMLRFKIDKVDVCWRKFNQSNEK